MQSLITLLLPGRVVGKRQTEGRCDPKKKKKDHFNPTETIIILSLYLCFFFFDHPTKKKNHRWVEMREMITKKNN